MQVLQTHQELPDDDRNILLRDQSRFHKIPAASARAIFHNNPQIGALEVGPMVLGDIRRIELGEDVDLLYDIVDLIFGILDIDYLDSYRLARSLIDALVDLAETSAAWTSRQPDLSGPSPGTLKEINKL
jgi:hypothetical protein